MASSPRSRAAVALVIAVVVGCVLMRPMSASAHSGNAVFETLTATGGSDLVIDLRVRVRYSADQEPAERAFLKATPHSPEGRTLAAVDLERAAQGIYEGRITVDAPGRWSLVVASAFPPGTTTVAVDVGNESSTLPWFVLGGGAGALALLIAATVAWRRRT